MLEIRPKRLWIGNAQDLRSPRELFRKGIAAVVDLAWEESPAVLPREMVYCRFPLHDGEGNNPATLRNALQLVVSLLVTEIPTVVGCSAGMSRSPAIAACALAFHLKQSPQDVLSQMMNQTSLEIHPALLNDLVGTPTDMQSP